MHIAKHRKKFPQFWSDIKQVETLGKWMTPQWRTRNMIVMQCYLQSTTGNSCTTSTTRTGNKQMWASPMLVPLPLLQDCIPGELLLCIFCYDRECHRRTCFKHKTKSGKNKVQGTILHEFNNAIFDIWGIVNAEANGGVVFIRTLEFNMICTTIVFR